VSEDLVQLYLKLCEEQSLQENERRRLWFAISEQIERVEAALTNPEVATVEEIEAILDRLNVPALHALADRARRSPAGRFKPPPRVEREPWAEDPRDVLVLYWKVVEDIISRTCGRFRLDEEEADTLESKVKERLFDKDCAIVRNFRHESSFRSYLNIIVQRTLANLQVERSGKWHYSRRAEVLGPMAKDLERMIYREGYMPSEAVSVLMTSHPDVSKADLERLLSELPVKRRRPVKVSVDDVEDSLPAVSPDVLMITGERVRLSDEAAAVVRPFMERLPEDDRLLLQFLLESDMKISKIAALLKREQKSLYRVRDELFTRLRKALEKANIRRADAADLFGYISDNSDFGFVKKKK
jgi:hypothetical protein